MINLYFPRRAGVFIVCFLFSLLGYSQNIRVSIRIAQIECGANNDSFSEDDCNFNLRYLFNNVGAWDSYCNEHQGNAWFTRTVNTTHVNNVILPNNSVVDIGIRGWEDDEGGTCIYNSGDDYYCDWKLAFNDVRFQNYPGCQWNSLGWNYSCNDFRIRPEIYWEYVADNPLPFGNNQWLVHAFNGGNIDLSGAYKGYYTETATSYNSLNRWCADCSPSNASGWSGCAVDINNHVVVSKRQGFPCGQYQLSMPNNDDDVRVYVNGTQVASGVCCNTLSGVFWTGYLGASSTIEVRHLEGGGGSNQSLTLTSIGGAPGNPSVFGNGSWNVYGYNAGNNTGGNGAWVDNYSGFYTENNLNLNTVPRWATTPSSANNASGAAYVGCPINNDYHSWSAKRTNIPCGIYQLEVKHDDRGQIFINGNSVYNDNACCASRSAGTYAISPTDQIEYRVSEGDGGSDGLITFNSVAMAALNPGSITYGGSTNSCGSYDPPAFGNGADASGGATSATGVANSSTTYQWQLNGVDIGGANAVTYDHGALGTGVHAFRRKTTDKCGSVAYSNSITINISAGVTITSTATNEACPADNNGSITGVNITGGLSNVRYIRVQQNTTDVINLAELQAFEVFTNTNVAAAKTATSSSVLSSYLPANFVDGNTNNFFHTFSGGSGEWVEVDLGAAYNLDRIKIWNRSDCCQNRSGNMQLILKNAAGTVIGSRQIDVYQGSNAQASPEFNVLDVSWADGATTLNRTGLDAATYTLNYSDISGCTVAHAKAVGTTNPSPVPSFTSISPSANICRGTEVTYTTQSGQSNYGWTFPGVAGTDYILKSGTGTASSNSANVAWLTGGNKQVGVSYQSPAGCPAVASTMSSAITINPLSGIVSSTQTLTCRVNGSLPVEFANTSGQLLLAIQSVSGIDLGDVEASAFVGASSTIQACGTSSGPDSQFNTAYMGRSWVVKAPAAPASPSLRATLPFTSSELAGLASTALTTTANIEDDITVGNNGSDLMLTKFTATNPANENGNPADNCATAGSSVAVGAPEAIGIIGGNRYVRYAFTGFSEWYLHGNNTSVSPLPIELVSFAASCTNGQVRLDWQTATEINNEKFIIDRSSDMQSWEHIITQSGAGNSNKPLNYTGVDARPLDGLSYYRLTQHDYDGASETFAPVSVTCYTDGNGNSMMVYPNPTDDKFTVNIHLVDACSDCSIEISDLNGKRIALRNVSMEKGENTYTFDRTSMNPGQYIIQLKSGDFVVKPVKLIIK